jgi:hypothetical protein
MQGVRDKAVAVTKPYEARDLACHASPCTHDKRRWLVPRNLGECNVNPFRE